MRPEFATKITDTIFNYHLIGFAMNVTYDSKNRNIVISEADTGAIIRVIKGAEDDEALSFEEFILISHDIFLDLVEKSN